MRYVVTDLLPFSIRTCVYLCIKITGIDEREREREIKRERESEIEKERKDTSDMDRSQFSNRRHGGIGG